MKATGFLSLLILSSVSLYGQTQLNTIQQAMKDELDRSMRELKREGLEAPMFISYSIRDGISYQGAATLGALIDSDFTPIREVTSCRVMVGSYEFNDESLESEYQGMNPEETSGQVELPMDDDYLGIRRTLWLMTDNVYRSASRQFQKKQEMVKELGKPLAEIPHRSFAKVPPSIVVVEGKNHEINKKELEEYLRKVSAIFLEYPEMENTAVRYRFSQGYRYLVNSEGSINKTPYSSGELVITMTLNSGNGDRLQEEVNASSSDTTLPNFTDVADKVKKKIDRLNKIKALPKFEDEYAGPVLFSGDFAPLLFLYNLGATVSDRNDVPRLKGYNRERSAPKIGRQFFSEGTTITAIPKTKSFGGVELLGSYEVDDEGTIPADATVLIENGLLKELVNDRTQVKENQPANGLMVNAGVFKVDVKNGVTKAQMKERLIEAARKEGLDYGIIIHQEWSNSPLIAIKVFVSDGHEEEFRQAVPGASEQLKMKRMLAASADSKAINLVAFMSDQMVSIIAPTAVLLEEVDIEAEDVVTEKHTEYVASPLKK